MVEVSKMKLLQVLWNLIAQKVSSAEEVLPYDFVFY